MQKTLRRFQALYGLCIGKKDHAAELVDYLGVLSVLEAGVNCGTPTVSPRSHRSCDTANISESISTQLTMFYAGNANGIADKIVLSSAEQSISMQAITPSFKVPMSFSTQPYGLQSELKEKCKMAAQFSAGQRLPAAEDDHAHKLTTVLVPCQAIVPTALPIARKASLARFLKKRKERVQMMAQYLTKGSVPNIIHQAGAGHSNASKLERHYHDSFDGRNAAKKLRCTLAFACVNNEDVADHKWFTCAENSEQASESESST